MAKKLKDFLHKEAAVTNTEEKETHVAAEGNGDTSPLIHNLAMKTTLVGKQEQTDIVALVHSGTGYSSKRMVIPGGVTAAKLAALLEDVANW